MQARIVDARRGVRWLAEGWRLFRVSPLGWLAAVFGFWLLLSIVSLVPFVGAPAAVILMPAFWVGFMALARAASRHAPLQLSLLFDGFRHELRPQLVLGVMYLGCLAVILWVSTLADDGALAQWVLMRRPPAKEAIESGAMVTSLAAIAALYLPVMLAFWFAAPLAAWHSTGAVKALFFSLAAAVMNWRAFASYGAVTALITMVLPVVLVLVLTALAAGQGSRIPVESFVMPLLIILLPTLFASFYASYRDVFGYDAAP